MLDVDLTDKKKGIHKQNTVNHQFKWIEKIILASLKTIIVFFKNAWEELCLQVHKELIYDHYFFFYSGLSFSALHGSRHYGLFIQQIRNSKYWSQNMYSDATKWKVLLLKPRQKVVGKNYVLFFYWFDVIHQSVLTNVAINTIWLKGFRFYK